MQRRHLILMRTGGPAQPRASAPDEDMVNASTRVLFGSRRAWLPDVLTAAAILALVLLAAVACSGGSGPLSASSGGAPAAGGPAAAPSAVGYSVCMRSHGVPNYPDPPNGGQVPKADPQQLEVSGTQLQGPKDPAGTCTRATAERSAPRSGNARKPATAHRPWCAG